MTQKNIKTSYSVAELIEVLKKYPQDLPVLVSGYEGGFENIMPPIIEKLTHKPENQYWDGEFQTAEEENEGDLEAVVLRRVFRDE
jgi:hypothetical protein